MPRWIKKWYIRRQFKKYSAERNWIPFQDAVFHLCFDENVPFSVDAVPRMDIEIIDNVKIYYVIYGVK